MQIIVKQSYSHINRSFRDWDTPQGRRVKDEKHYRQLCEEQGLIPYEQAVEKAERNRKGRDYVLSKEAREIINEAKAFKGNNGTFRSADCPKLIDKMVAKGIVKKKDAFAHLLPKHYQKNGGYTT